MNSETHTGIHYNQTSESEDKDRILKAAGEKWLITYKISSIRSSAEVFIRNFGSQKAVG